MITAIGLASEGFAGGDPGAVLAMPVRTVIDISHYVAFRQQYLINQRWLNQEDAKK